MMNATAAAKPATADLDLAASPESLLDPKDWTDRKASAQALRAATARNSSGRRRFIDPTTCDREYSIAEREFMEAMQTYKHRSGRMFPTWSEVLEVLLELGYEKVLPGVEAVA